MCVKDDLTIPGEVYKAKDTRLDRTVAIKVLPSELAQDPGRRERFEREARAVASLNHPHICTLYDIGRENGIDFLVMEHIEGETLADVLRKRALPLDRALRAGIQLADALDKAHRQGVVHRDVKPRNIMLSSGVKLLDFGLARSRPKAELAADSESPTKHKPLTEEGALLGTVPYMAPEQLEGKEADERTDIFALGAVLYEMVSGKRLSTIPRLSPSSSRSALRPCHVSFRSAWRRIPRTAGRAHAISQRSSIGWNGRATKSNSLRREVSLGSCGQLLSSQPLASRPWFFGALPSVLRRR